MKILLINDYATPTAGAELLTLLLRDGLQKKGHDVRVFSSCAQLIDGKSFADYRCFGTNSRLQVLLQPANFSAYFKLRRVLADLKPDVVHVNMFLWQLSPLILPLLKDVPCLYHVMTYKPICPVGSKMLPDRTPCQDSAGAVCFNSKCLTWQSWLPFMVQLKLWQRCKNVFDMIITNSENVRQRLCAEGIEATETVFPGVPIRPYSASLSNPPTAVFAGRLVGEKGVDTLLRAFSNVAKQIPAAKLILSGEGPQKSNLEKLITELALSSSVSMTGQLSRAEMERRFESAWVQIVPSLWEEPFGLVAAEAMMRGTAVIATSVGGLTESVQHGKTGLIVPPADEGALTAALIKMLSNRQMAEQMGKTGRKIALSKFGATAFIEKMLGLYHKILENSDKMKGINQWDKKAPNQNLNPNYQSSL